MKIGFLVWQTGKNRKKGKYKIVYEWESLQNSHKGLYTKEIYKSIKFLEQNTLLEEAVSAFHKKFPVKESLEEILSALSEWRNQGLLKPKDSWLFHKLLPKKDWLKATWFITKFMLSHCLAISLRAHLESIFYFGFVGPEITCVEKPLDIYIPDEMDDNFGFNLRSPVTVSLNSAKLTKKEVKAFIDREWPRIKAYFSSFPAVMDDPVTDREFTVFQSRKKGKKHREILEIFDASKENSSLEEYESDSVENITETFYRSNKKIKRMCWPKNITKK